MKTSLNIEDSLFQAAQKEAQKAGRTLSETISLWARVGRDALNQKKRLAGKQVQPVDLGGPARIDLASRRDWMDTLDT